MKRKVVLSGGKTCIVSLPKSWVDKHTISKGDSVEIQDCQTHLQIYPPKATPVRNTIDINLTDTAPITRRIIAALYKAGYDEIRVTFSTPEELASIQEVVRQGFVGFELVHEGRNSILIKNVSNPSPDEYDTVLRRLIYLLKTNANESLDATRKQDKHWLATIALRDTDVNKLADFLRRILATNTRTIRTHPRYVLVEIMSKIGNCYRDYCELAKATSPDKLLIELHSRVNAVLGETLGLFHDFSAQKLTCATATNTTTRFYSRSIALNITGAQVLLWSQLDTILEYLRSMTGALAGAHL